MSAGTETATAYAILNVGAVGIVGTFLGMPLDALFLGAFAGFLVLGFNKEASKTHGVVTVCMASLLAGALTPVCIKFLSRHFDIADSIDEEVRVLHPIVPVVIGASWQWALPRITDFANSIYLAAKERVMNIITGGKEK